MSEFEAGDDCTETTGIDFILPHALYNAGIDKKIPLTQQRACQAALTDPNSE